MKLCTYNLLNCPRCVQRRFVVGLAPGEESFDLPPADRDVAECTEESELTLDP